MMQTVRVLVLAAAVGAAWCAIAAADTTQAPWAVGVSDAKKAEANRFLEQGNVLFLDKKYSEALAKYRQAVIAWDHPAIRFNIVRCLIQLDRPVEAAESLQATLRYGAAPLEDAVHTEALAYEKLLAKQVGDVTIACEQRGVELTLDGQRIATCPARETRRMSLGKHQLLGTGVELLPRVTEFVVIGGESQRVEVTLDQVPRGGGVSGRSYGKVALYTGGGLLLVAGGLGLWAWQSYHGAFPAHCVESTTGGAPLCDMTGADRLDRARFFGDLATVAAGVGGVAMIAGAIALWRYPNVERRAVVSATSNSVGLGVRGTF